MRIHISLIPQDIIEKYKAMKFVDNDGYTYVIMTGVMYELARGSQIANKDLQKHLAKYEYHPTKRTQGLWKQKTRPIDSTFLVDDFGIKYTKKTVVDHLFVLIKDKYLLKIDWTGSKYIGIDL